MKEMVGGCCVCSDERGWTENPLVYCDGQGCNVAVHQGKYENIIYYNFIVYIIVGCNCIINLCVHFLL